MIRIGNATVVDIETGEVTVSEEGGMYMLPAPPGACPECYTAHDPALPHNQQSLSYQVRFHAAHGRYPTWTDAMAHCEPGLRAAWRERLIDLLREEGQPVPPDLATSTSLRAER